jgi:putative glycerol-1-phosphate prenyltransferase
VYTSAVYKELTDRKTDGKKSLAQLIDPDKLTPYEAIETAESAKAAGTDFIFVGGSLLVTGEFDRYVQQIKQAFGGPVILFPGSVYQVSAHADALLLLSIISGRNAEMLIGRQVVSAPMLRQSRLEILSTGYMLIENGKTTTVEYMSHTTPIPRDKNDIAMCTAMAGEMLGMKLIYMDAGSGAEHPVSAAMIRAVAQQVSVPLIVGGGIRTPEKAVESCKAGADVVVIGNAAEKDPSVVREISAAIRELNS